MNRLIKFSAFPIVALVGCGQEAELPESAPPTPVFVASDPVYPSGIPSMTLPAHPALPVPPPLPASPVGPVAPVAPVALPSGIGGGSVAPMPPGGDAVPPPPARAGRPVVIPDEDSPTHGRGKDARNFYPVPTL